MEKHLRVDTLGEGLAEQEGEHKQISRSGRNTCVNPWEDFTRTIFIGNLPFIVSEEELRAQFAPCGTIENIRLVRDPKTHLGKGIGYIMFSTKDEMQQTLKEKKGMKFKGRELRINRAVEPKRREKKKNRQAVALEERRERRKQKQEMEDEADQLGRLGEIESEDSEDEKGKKRKAERQIKLESSGFGQKPASKADMDAKRELDLNNIHAIARRKKQALLSNMIKKGTSFKRESMQRMGEEEKDLYKGKHDTFKKGLVQKIAKRKADNLKKINKIKIKTKKI